MSAERSPATGPSLPAHAGVQGLSRAPLDGV